MFKLDLHSRQPIYEQLKNKISELVMLGQLEPDAPLPSVRGIARELGVNPNTVQKAYQELERAGIIYTVPGKGSFINPEADLGGELKKTHLTKIQAAALQARQCGIGLEEILSAVREVYGEERRR